MQYIVVVRRIGSAAQANIALLLALVVQMQVHPSPIFILSAKIKVNEFT